MDELPLEKLLRISKLKYSNNEITELFYGGVYHRPINKLPSLSSLKNLVILNLELNYISSIPPLYDLSNLEVLNCSCNKLTELPDLDSLKKLQLLKCSFNKLTKLPNLDHLVNLIILECDFNNLTKLPSLDNQTKLEILNISNNNLICLPSFKMLTNLGTFRSSGNLLKTLPRTIIYCKKLKFINCEENIHPDIKLCLLKFFYEKNKLNTRFFTIKKIAERIKKRLSDYNTLCFLYSKKNFINDDIFEIIEDFL